MAELERARVLVVDVGLSSGDAAKLLAYEFGRPRKADGVRHAMRKYFGWRGTPHGDPSAIRKRQAT